MKVINDKLTSDELETVEKYSKYLRIAKKGDKVFKDQCAFTFYTPACGSGLYVNLKTFTAISKEYLDVDYKKNKTSVYLHQKWKTKDKKIVDKNDVVDGKITEIGIGTKGGFNLDIDIYEKIWSVVYIKDDGNAKKHVYTYENVDVPSHDELTKMKDVFGKGIRNILEAVIGHTDGTVIESQWKKAEAKPSKFSDNLIQIDNGVKISMNPKDWECADSGLKENLWLNLSDGYIGSGRKQDGVKGTGAALKHYEETGKKYHLAVKLGTITPNGADVYSYGEYDMVVDTKLKEHLAFWGIDMDKMHKTEATLNEMELEFQFHDYSSISEEGKDLEKLSGANYVGLRNIGNSCYLNSFFQMFFSLSEVQKRYVVDANKIFKESPGKAADDLTTQLAKLGVALCSDKYSKEKEEKMDIEGEEKREYDLAPVMLRAVVGRGHAEFSTGKQQDVHEYYQHFLSSLQKEEHKKKYKQKLGSLFKFEVEERLVDCQSKKVRYSRADENTLTIPIEVADATNLDEVKNFKPTEEQKKNKVEAVYEIPFEKCIARYLGTSTIEGFKSPVTGKRGKAEKEMKIATFPPYLAVKMKRYVYNEKYQPVKLSCSVKVPEELDLSLLRAKGKQDGEEELGEEDPVDKDKLAMLGNFGLGFGKNAMSRALIATNNNVEQAVNWLLGHSADANFNDPITKGGPKKKKSADPAKVSQVTMMGLTEKQAVAGLNACGGDVGRAVEWIFARIGTPGAFDDEPVEEEKVLDGEPKYELIAILSHIGRNTGSGHYVAHVKKKGEWAIFDDQKVCKSEQPPFGLGYMYVFRRKDA